MNNVGFGAESTKVGIDDGLRRKLTSGVNRVESGRFRARVMHPKMKVRVSLGTYDTLEDAAPAIQNKREQFEMQFGLNKQLSRDHNGIDQSNNRVEEQFGDGQLPVGVRPTRTGKWGAWIKDPMSGMECMIASYNTIKEAAIAVERKRVKLEMLFESRKRAKTNNEILDQSEKPKCGFDHGSPSSVFEAENSSEPAMSFHESGGGDANAKHPKKTSNEVLDNPEEPKCGVDHIGSPTSVFGAEDSNEPIMSVHESEGGDSDTNAKSSKETSNEILGNSEKLKCGADHVGSPTSVFGAEKSSEPSMSVHESESGDYDTNASARKTSNEVINNPEKPNCGFNQIGSPTVSAHENEAVNIDTNVETQQKLLCASSFEEWVRLGIIDECGQLLGEYNKLDDGLWFNDQYNNEGIVGYY